MKFWSIIFGLLAALTGCQDKADSSTDVIVGSAEPNQIIQRQFKLIEKWQGRWCADETWENLNGCEGTEALNQLFGAIGAANGANGKSPMVLDASTATLACLDADPDAIADVNMLLGEGARVVVWGNQISQYKTRTTPDEGQKDYQLIFCNYRQVILEGPGQLLR